MTTKTPEALAVLQDCANALCTHESAELAVRCNKARAAFAELTEAAGEIRLTYEGDLPVVRGSMRLYQARAAVETMK